MSTEEIRRSLDAELQKTRHSSGTHDDFFNDGYECALRYAMEQLPRSLLSGSLTCFLDGKALCVVGPGFVDLQESEAVFLELTTEQLAIIERLKDR